MRRTIFANLLVIPVLLASAQAWANPYFESPPVEFTSAACPDGCWTNYLRVVDLNGDGHLDAVFVNYSGFFNNGTAQALELYYGDGTGEFTNASQAAIGGHSGRIRQVAIGDIDADGDPDMFVPGAQAEGDAFFINDGEGNFTDEIETRLSGGTQLHVGATRFGDLDNDGDLDLVVADGYTTAPEVYGAVFLNDGAGVFSPLAGAIPPGFDGEDPTDLDLVDVDNDFDLDIIVDAHSGDNSLWLNDGNGTFIDASDALPGQVDGLGFHYNNAPCDVDGDGDLDVWLDNAGASYAEQLLINDGEGNFTDETAARVSGNPNNDDNGIVCIDVDGDGDQDAIVLALGSPERLLTNDGEGNFAYVPDAMPVIVDATLWGEAGDFDEDGRLDLMTGQGEAGDFAERLYLGAVRQPIDEQAPVLRAVEALAQVEVGVAPRLRFAVSDSTNTDGGPWLQRAFVRVTVGDQQPEEIDARFIGGDLFSAELPRHDVAGATIQYVACAIDRAGNEACGESQTYTVEASEGETSGATETNGSSTTGESDGTATGADEGSTSGPTPTTTDAPTSGETGDPSDSTGAPADGDAGCGCTASGSPTKGLLSFGWLMVLVGIRSRRRAMQAT